MKTITTSTLLFLGAFLSLGRCWDAPGFCRGYECPVYTLVNTYEGFEERLYSATRWITTDIASIEEKDVLTGFRKLYDFMNGRNKDEKTIAMTRPVAVSVHGSAEERIQPSIRFFIAPDTELPETNDDTIKIKDLPSGTVYVRVFGGIATEADVVKNREDLKKALLAAGKLFDDNNYEAAGYDGLLDLFNRHNEVWIRVI